MTTTQLKSNHYDPVALEEALRKFEQEEFDAHKNIIVKAFHEWLSYESLTVKARDSITQRDLLEFISKLALYAQEQGVNLPEDISSELDAKIRTEKVEELTASIMNGVREKLSSELDTDEDLDSLFDFNLEEDNDYDDLDDDDLEDHDLDDDEDDESGDDAAKNWPYSYSTFADHAAAYDISETAKDESAQSDQCDPTRGWTVVPEFVPTKPTLEPVLFENPLSFKEFFAIREALSKHEQLTELQQKQFQEYKNLALCTEQTCQLKDTPQGFNQADFEHNSHPYLIQFGQLYQRPFVDHSPTQQVADVYTQAEEITTKSPYDFVKSNLKDTTYAPLRSYPESGWKLVTDKALLQAFANKPDGRYPLEFVKPVNFSAPGNPQAKLKYLKQLVLNFNIDELHELENSTHFYTLRKGIEVEDLANYDADTAGFARRELAFNSFFKEIAAVLCQFDYYDTLDFQLADLGYLREFAYQDYIDSLDDEDGNEDEALFAECTRPWLVFNGRVFRLRLHKHETSPTAPEVLNLDYEQVPKDDCRDDYEEDFKDDYAEDFKDDYEDDHEDDSWCFFDTDEDLGVSYLKQANASKLDAGPDDVIYWLLKNGWIEVVNCEQIPETSYFSQHLGEVVYVTRQYTPEHLELFKLLPNGFYSRPPHYSDAWVTTLTPTIEADDSLSEESALKKIQRKIIAHNDFTDYKGKPIGFDNDFYYHSNEPVLFAGLSKQDILNHLTCQLIEGRSEICTYRHFDFAKNSHPFAIINGKLYCRSLNYETSKFIRDFDFDSLPELERNQFPTSAYEYERHFSWGANHKVKNYNLLFRPGVDFDEEFALAGWLLVVDYRLINHFAGFPDGRYPQPTFCKNFSYTDQCQLYFHSESEDESLSFVFESPLELLTKLTQRFNNFLFSLAQSHLGSRNALTAQEQTILRVHKRISEITQCLLGNLQGLDEYVLLFDKTDEQRKQLESFACPNLDALVCSANQPLQNQDKTEVNAQVLTATELADFPSVSSSFTEPTFASNRLPLLVKNGQFYRVRTEGETSPYFRLSKKQVPEAWHDLPDGRYSLPPGFKLDTYMPNHIIELLDVTKKLHQILNESDLKLRSTKIDEFLDFLKGTGLIE